MSSQIDFKLNRNVMTVVFDLAGHEEWLRLRQVCRLFDDASYSMAKWWPAWAQEQLVLHAKEEKEILVADGLAKLIKTIRADITKNFNNVVSHREMKSRIISLFTERKTCFAVQRRWKPANEVSSSPTA